MGSVRSEQRRENESEEVSDSNDVAKETCNTLDLPILNLDFEGEVENESVISFFVWIMAPYIYQCFLNEVQIRELLWVTKKLENVVEQGNTVLH